LGDGTRARNLRGGTNKDRKFMRHNALLCAFGYPLAHAVDFFLFVLKQFYSRCGAIENRHGAAPVLQISVQVCHFSAEESIGLRADLMRSSVINGEVLRTTADVYSEFDPRERLLENPLTQVTSKEKALRTVSA